MNEKTVLEVARFCLLQIVNDYKDNLVMNEEPTASPRSTWLSIVDEIDDSLKQGSLTFADIPQLVTTIQTLRMNKRGFWDDKPNDYSALFKSAPEITQKALVAVVQLFGELMRASAYKNKSESKDMMLKIPKLVTAAQTNFIALMNHLLTNSELTPEQRSLLDVVSDKNQAALLSFRVLAQQQKRLFFSYMAKVAELKVDIKKLNDLLNKVPYAAIFALDLEFRNAVLDQLIGYCGDESVTRVSDNTLAELYSEQSQILFKARITAMILSVFQTMDDEEQSYGHRPHQTISLLLGQEPEFTYDDLPLHKEVRDLSELTGGYQTAFKRELESILEGAIESSVHDKNNQQFYSSMLRVVRGEEIEHAKTSVFRTPE